MRRQDLKILSPAFKELNNFKYNLECSGKKVVIIFKVLITTISEYQKLILAN